MKAANIHKTKITLYWLIKRIISQVGKPVVRLVAYESEREPRQPGSWEGKIAIARDFDAPLPPDIMCGFLGDSG